MGDFRWYISRNRGRDPGGIMTIRLLFTFALLGASIPAASADNTYVLSRSGVFLSNGEARLQGPSYLQTAMKYTRKLALERAWSKAYDSCKPYADAYAVQSGLKVTPSIEAAQQTEAIYDCNLALLSYPGEYTEVGNTYDSYDVKCVAQATFTCVLHQKF